MEPSPLHRFFLVRHCITVQSPFCFSTPQAGVGLIGGYFNAVGSTAITAYAADGSVIGSVTNSVTGDEFLGLVTSD